MTNSWYSAGTITAQKGSTVVTGVETYWLEADIKKGDALLINNILCQISEIQSSTSLILARTFTGDSVQGASYEIIPRAQQVLAVDIAEKLQRLIDKIKEQESEISEIVAYAAKFKKAGLGVTDDHRIYQGEPEADPIDSGDIATDNEIDSLIDDVYSN